MSETFDDWNPMSDDFESIAFNSYSSGQTAAHLPRNLVPGFGSEFCETKRPPKLFIEGFPSDLTESGLKNLLQRIGCKVSSLKILRNRTRLGRHFSLVGFESTHAAQTAIQLIRSQSLFKLSVRFATTQSDRQNLEVVIERENQEFNRLLSKQTDMKPKIDIGNCSAINANSNGDTSSMSPIQSDSGSLESSNLEVLSPLAKSDKLVKVLDRPEDNCSFCVQKQPLEHLHFILSEQQIIDPSQLPALIEIMNVCMTCARKAIDMKVCSQCKGANYCDRKCQSKDWARHRLECKAESNRFLSFNSTLDSSKPLNGSVSQTERNVEPIKTLTKPIESTTTASKTSASVAQPSPPKTISTTNRKIVNTVSVSPKESTPIIGDRVDSLKQNVNTPTVPSIPKEVPKNNVSIDKTAQELTKLTINVVKNDSHNICQSIETEVLIDGEEGVSVCFGRNPFDFYLQKSSSVDKMDAFVDELYNKMNEFPSMSQEQLKKGALCGGIYSVDGNCYRTRIDNKVSDDKYSLYFIDYGNTEEVIKKDIKVLPIIFFSCKAQAIHCSLNNLYPKGKGWSREAIALFSEIGETNEYSKVMILDKTNEGVYKIDLFNKNGESIRKIFVDKGFATLSEELSETNSNSVRTPVSSPKKASQVVTPVKGDSPVVVQGSPKVLFDKTSIDKIGSKFVKPMTEFEEKSGIVFKSYLDSVEDKSEIAFMITNVLNDEEFQYFGTAFVTEVQELILGLAQTYSANKQITSPEVGDLVVVQGSDDEFYRSYVLSIEPNGAKVYMIDSGFIEDITKNKIFKMIDELSQFPVFGFMFLPDTEIGARLIELSHTNESSIDGTLIRKNEKLFLETNGTVIQLLEYKPIIEFLKRCDNVFEKKVTKSGDPYKDLPLRELPLNKKLESLVLFQDPIEFKVFYVAGDADDCTVLMNLCSEYSKKFDNNIKVNPLPGNVYLVRSSADMEWYRALVYGVDGNKVSVKYIDFGNDEDIDIEYVMELSHEIQISTIKPLAIKCKVSSTKLSDDELKAKIERASEGAMMLKVEVISIEDGFHFVKVK